MTMRTSSFLVLLFAAGVASAACPSGLTCLSWKGDGNYTDGKPIPANFVVTYTVHYGPKSGPYTPLAGYNGSPTQALAVQFATPAKPKLCFRVTATADSPEMDKDGKLTGKLVKATSDFTGEVCDTVSLPPPTDGRIEAPTDGSIEN
jgi:hypothetical protein